MWARSNRVGNALIMIRWAVSWSDDGFSSLATEGGGRLRLPYVGIRRLTSFEIALYRPGMERVSRAVGSCGRALDLWGLELDSAWMTGRTGTAQGGYVYM